MIDAMERIEQEAGRLRALAERIVAESKTDGCLVARIAMEIANERAAEVERLLAVSEGWGQA